MAGQNQVNGAASVPEYGKRLIPNIIDEISRDDPSREAFQIPNSTDPKDGWTKVTYRQYANAINYVAHQIVEWCGEPQKDSFPTIAYIGPNDARYVVMFVGAIKAGYKALFISPRNSHEAQTNLFVKTDCRFIIYPKSQSAMVQPWLQGSGVRPIEIGSLDEWFPPAAVPHFPYEKTFEQAQWDPVVVLHTSGSTGLPKPVVARVGMLSTGDAFHNFAELQGTEFFLRTWADRSKRHFLPVPLFHAAGLYSFINAVLHWDRPVVFCVDRPLSPDLVLDCLNNLDVESTLLPPVILEYMSLDVKYVKALQRLNLVWFGGGTLGLEAGKRLAASGIHLMNGMSATECMPYPLYTQFDKDLWQYYVFNSDVFGADWRKTDEDDVCELVILRKDKHPGLQGIFYTFPDDEEYHTNDLYKRHPTLPDQWMFWGRADNIIVFSNGEKLNPVTIEETVQNHPQVKGTLVVGSNRFQPGLVIEPMSHPKSKEDEETLIDAVWPLVAKVNNETVAHGRISRELVALSNPDKPFPRSGKGTIQQAAALQLYKDDIDNLYDHADAVESSEAPTLDVSSENSLMESIQTLFHIRLGSPLGPDTDFFSVGIDSLQIINATRLIRAGLSAAGHHVDDTDMAARSLYKHSTPRRLAQYILQKIVRGEARNVEHDDTEPQKVMNNLYEKYAVNIHTAKEYRPRAGDEKQTVVLTGSTGMLGSYLLDNMAKNPKVKKIVCLNRAEDGGVKQQAEAMKYRGLDAKYTDKTEFHHIDISRSDLGLPGEVYSRLLKDVDRWIHNAWPVNFNITIETFEPQLRGVRNVADFATQAEKRVAVVFISSIGTADKWDTKKGPVPEERLEDMGLPGAGYGRSKMVGSMILEDAAKTGDFPAATIRVGQIAGPEADAGAWNRHEWLPTIIASSLYLKALPSDLGIMSQIDWTPVESIASLVLEVAGVAQLVDPKDISGYYHGVNPSRTTWQELAPAVREFYGEDRLPEVVSFKEWVDRLERSSQTDDVKSLVLNPGIKLIDTYRDMSDAALAGHEQVEFDMQRTKERSPTMRDAKAVTPGLMAHWCKQWGF